MTVSRALRGVARAMSVLVAALALVAPAALVGSAHADEASPSTTLATTLATPQVASEAPTPVVAVAGAPRVGPLDAGVGDGKGAGVWWLFGLGAAQVAILFVMTRRSRARLSPQDVAP